MKKFYSIMCILWLINTIRSLIVDREKWRELYERFNVKFKVLTLISITIYVPIYCITWPISLIHIIYKVIKDLHNSKEIETE